MLTQMPIQSRTRRTGTIHRVRTLVATILKTQKADMAMAQAQAQKERSQQACIRNCTRPSKHVPRRRTLPLREKLRCSLPVGCKSLLMVCRASSLRDRGRKRRYSFIV